MVDPMLAEPGKHSQDEEYIAILSLFFDETYEAEIDKQSKSWEFCKKRFGKDNKDQVDWFCLAIGAPTAYEKEGFSVWASKRDNCPVCGEYGEHVCQLYKC